MGAFSHRGNYRFQTFQGFQEFQRRRSAPVPGANPELRQNVAIGTAGTCGTIGTVASVRLDTWLDVACLFKTRSEATKACRLNKVIVGGQAAKAHRIVKAGDELEIHRPMGRKQLVTVLSVADSQPVTSRSAAALRRPHAQADRGRNRDSPPGTGLSRRRRPRRPGPIATSGGRCGGSSAGSRSSMADVGFTIQRTGGQAVDSERAYSCSCPPRGASASCSWCPPRSTSWPTGCGSARSATAASTPPRSPRAASPGAVDVRAGVRRGSRLNARVALAAMSGRPDQLHDARRLHRGAADA